MAARWARAAPHLILCTARSCAPNVEQGAGWAACKAQSAQLLPLFFKPRTLSCSCARGHARASRTAHAH
eukprot:5665039-Pleurochrysis_carterae.AAC.1